MTTPSTGPSIGPDTRPTTSIMIAVPQHARQLDIDARGRLSLRDHIGDHVREPTVAEFFAGIGLMRLGLERAGWRTVWANDIDPKKRMLYVGAFGADEGVFQLGDVFTLDAANIPTVTLATASFPCVDLSLAGGRVGLAGKESSAFWGFVRVLKALGARRPPLLLLENVPALISSRRGEDFLALAQALADLGYQLDSFVVDARYFTPQSRPRLFLAGVLAADRDDGAADGADASSDAGVAAGLAPSELRPQALLSAIGRSAARGVRWRLRPLPALPERSQRLEDALEELPDSAPEWLPEARVAARLAEMSPTHRATVERLRLGAASRYGTAFRRTRPVGVRTEVRFDGVAGCLRTARGGSNRQIVFKVGAGRVQARWLTPRDAAALMGASDFRLAADGVAPAAVCGAFGDAVCADVVAWIARHALNPLLEEINGKIARRKRVQRDREGDCQAERSADS